MGNYSDNDSTGPPIHQHTTQSNPPRNTANMSDDEERVTMPFKFVTAGFDARFPNQNQTKHCWQNYVDYHQFILAYRSLCPSSWCERWDDQRENGTFPARLDQ